MTYPRTSPTRAFSALAGVSGILLLAGCTPKPAATEVVDEVVEQSSESAAASETPAAAAAEEPNAGGTYSDGTYSAEGSYQTPESVETINVSVTVAGDAVTAVEVTGNPQARQSQDYQSQFIGGIAEQVVGVPLDEVQVSRVAGSSLTSSGFMSALDSIREQAQN